MITRAFKIINETGVHARPASDLCKLCKSFTSDIRIIAGDKKINPRSIVSILTGEMVSGKQIDVTISGDDEVNCMAALDSFFVNLQD